VFHTLVLLLLAAASVSGGSKLPVVTASTDLKALVEAVGEERVQVESLAPPLQNPHAVEVKPAQLTKLKTAALFVRIGLDHEPWLARALRSVNDPRFVRESPHYLDTSKGVQLLQAETPRVKGERGVHVHGFGNTHYWLDPENAPPMTRTILDALGKLAPADRPYFEANQKRFLEQLDARLARWLKAFAPYRTTRVAVVHETWPYFDQRFGLVVVGVVEPTPGVPPSPSYLAALTQRMREGRVRLLIAEPYSNASVVRQVATRSGARAVTLIPSVGGDPGAADYLGLFDLNIKRLTEALAAAP
jgi:ABC-type Zn uptake system ZnuABC Zn-binding protein ZnuA